MHQKKKIITNHSNVFCGWHKGVWYINVATVDKFLNKITMLISK